MVSRISWSEKCIPLCPTVQKSHSAACRRPRNIAILHHASDKRGIRKITYFIPSRTYTWTVVLVIPSRCALLCSSWTEFISYLRSLFLSRSSSSSTHFCSFCWVASKTTLTVGSYHFVALQSNRSRRLETRTLNRARRKRVRLRRLPNKTLNLLFRAPRRKPHRPPKWVENQFYRECSRTLYSYQYWPVRILAAGSSAGRGLSERGRYSNSVDTSTLRHATCVESRRAPSADQDTGVQGSGLDIRPDGPTTHPNDWVSTIWLYISMRKRNFCYHLRLFTLARAAVKDEYCHDSGTLSTVCLPIWPNTTPDTVPYLERWPREFYAQP